jgi:glycosyltransferase involved in cell wall biosynthesis
MPTVVTVFGLASRYIGGSENYARELAIQLDTHGWHCVFCFLATPPPEVLEYLNLPNVSIEVLENSDARGPSYATLKKLSDILSTYKATILHLHLVGFVGLFPWLAKLRSVKKIFFTHHMSYPEGFVPQRAAFWKRLLVRAINWPMTAVICVSEYNRSCISALDVLPAEKYKRIYNAVDFDRVAEVKPQIGVEFRARYDIPADRVVVLQVSWIIRDKGIDDHLEAARLVLSENENCHFVFAGDGADRESFMQKAEAIGIGDHVTWTGLVQDPFALGLYDAADIVCQPSRWEEAFGQVIAEAMACAKPVVATRVGGIPEVIEDGKSGFLVERGDVPALAKTILKLAGDSALRCQLGRVGLQIAKQKFDLKVIVKQVVRLYGVEPEVSIHPADRAC